MKSPIATIIITRPKEEYHSAGLAHEPRLLLGGRLGAQASSACLPMRSELGASRCTKPTRAEPRFGSLRGARLACRHPRARPAPRPSPIYPALPRRGQATNGRARISSRGATRLPRFGLSARARLGPILQPHLEGPGLPAQPRALKPSRTAPPAKGANPGRSSRLHALERRRKPREGPGGPVERRDLPSAGTLFVPCRPALSRDAPPSAGCRRARVQGRCSATASPGYFSPTQPRTGTGARVTLGMQPFQALSAQLAGKAQPSSRGNPR